MRGRADRTALSDVSEAPTVPPRSPECLPFNNPPLSVIPRVPGFPTSPLSPATTYVVLPKENHMQLTEAAILDRKSGGAEGPAVPRTFVEMFSVLTHGLKALLSASVQAERLETVN
jgi:hypothetical protein